MWLKLGADPNKLVMGLALYGKTFKLCNKGFEPGDKSCGSANPDTLNYYEVKLFHMQSFLKRIEGKMEMLQV